MARRRPVSRAVDPCAGTWFSLQCGRTCQIWNLVPPIHYETSIVAILVSIALYGLYNVQIVVAADSTQHDVADGERRSVYWLSCTKPARFDSAPHRASVRAERYCLSGPELINVSRARAAAVRFFRALPNPAKRHGPRSALSDHKES